MMKPSHDACRRMRLATVGKRLPVDHDHGNLQSACCLYLGDGTRSAGVFCNDPLDAMTAHKNDITSLGEGTTRDDDGVVWKERRPFRRINEAQDVVMLRLGRKGIDMLATDREKNALPGTCQRGNCAGDVLRCVPVVSGGGLPGWPCQRDQRNTKLVTRRNSVMAHLRCKGVGRVNDMGDGVFAQVGGKPIDAAEAADPMCDGLLLWSGNAPRIGERCRDASLGHHMREGGCLGGAAQDQEIVAHGR